MSESGVAYALGSDVLLADLGRSLQYAWLAALVGDRSVIELAPADEIRSALPADLGVRLGFTGPATPWFTGEPAAWSNVGGLVDPALLPFGDGALGVLVCFDGLARMRNPTGFLDEATRVLDAGGLFVASTRTDSDGRRPGGPPGGPSYSTGLLLAQVERRFAHTAVLEERLFLATMLAPEVVGAGPVAVDLPRFASDPRGVVVVATDGSMPDLRPVVTVEPGVLFAAWLDEVDRLAATAHRAVAELARLRTAESVEHGTAGILAEHSMPVLVRRLRRLARTLRRLRSSS